MIELTPQECRALRLAVVFGKPDQGHPDLDSAVSKLVAIEVLQEEPWPKAAPAPAPEDMVQVLMPEKTARLFEANLIKPSGGKFAPAVFFGPDDLPSYIIGPV